MADFLYDSNLNSAVQDIIESARETLILITPYIKLHDRLISVLGDRKEDDGLHITVVFGKNEEDITKSLGKEDFEFFKDFPNIDICYQRRLHAKYYANEHTGVLTSMNLYSFSQNNNIEFGVLSRKGRFTKNQLDIDSWNYFMRVIEQADPFFRKVPEYKDSFWGSKYKSSLVEIDKLSPLYGLSSMETKKRTERKPQKPKQEFKSNDSHQGYCIRTGESIPFNPKRPFSDKAYASWAKYGDENYKEKYCHFSGEPSKGETSYARPILRKNWQAAKKKFNF